MNVGVLAHAGDLFQEYFPVVFLAAGAYVVMTVLKEGAQKRDSTPETPPNPLHAALRSKQGRERSTAPSKSWGSWDSRPPKGPRLHGTESEAAGGRLEPPPPASEE